MTPEQFLQLLEAEIGLHPGEVLYHATECKGGRRYLGARFGDAKAVGSPDWYAVTRTDLNERTTEIIIHEGLRYDPLRVAEALAHEWRHTVDFHDGSQTNVEGKARGTEIRWMAKTLGQGTAERLCELHTLGINWRSEFDPTDIAQRLMASTDKHWRGYCRLVGAQILLTNAKSASPGTGRAGTAERLEAILYARRQEEQHLTEILIRERGRILQPTDKS